MSRRDSPTPPCPHVCRQTQTHTHTHTHARARANSHNREFSIVRERRHVTPCLSSAPSSTGYCEPVCGQREIGRFRVQDLYVDYRERMSHERNEEM